MSYLNTPIPIMDGYIRGNFLRDQKDSHDKKFPCLIFGMCSIPGQAPLFHFVMEDGGIWWRMPIHAFCWKEDAVEQELDELVLWDSFSYHVSATQFPYLKNKIMNFTSRRRVKYAGRYLFTLDWAASTDSGDTDFLFSEYPSQHKCGHVIAMDNGNFAIQPNNRLLLHDPSYTVKEDLVINRMYNNTIWSAERNKRWVTPDTDNMQYDHTDLDAGESNRERSKEYDEKLNTSGSAYRPNSLVKNSVMRDPNTGKLMLREDYENRQLGIDATAELERMIDEEYTKGVLASLIDKYGIHDQEKDDLHANK